MLKNKDINKFKELYEDMKKYRTEHYVDTEREKGQTFDLFRKVYKLNPLTNELEETLEQVDIKEQIQSALSSSMASILDRLMPTDCPTNDEVVTYSAMKEDLDIMQSFAERAEYYKDKFNLDPSLSVSQVFEFVGNKSKEIKQKFQTLEKEQVENEKEKEIK